MLKDTNFGMDNNKQQITYICHSFMICFQMQKMAPNKKVFFIAFGIFLVVIVGITIDMASRTTAPWNKKKQIVRAWSDEAENDTIKDRIEGNKDTFQLKKAFKSK